MICIPKTGSLIFLWSWILRTAGMISGCLFLFLTTANTGRNRGLAGRGWEEEAANSRHGREEVREECTLVQEGGRRVYARWEGEGRVYVRSTFLLCCTEVVYRRSASGRRSGFHFPTEPKFPKRWNIQLPKWERRSRSSQKTRIPSLLVWARVRDLST